MTPIKHLLHIKSNKEEVFSALSKPDKISKWYTTIVKGEFKLDQIVIFEFVNFASFKFKITEYVQDELITMECVESDMPVVGHVMKYEIDENDGKSRVRYSYNGFLEMDDSYANMNFSSAKYLESLRQFCQTGIGEAFGSDNYRS
ncbi:MAG: SRPBCC domain-containing protein [Flavobacteriaceae bacterium]|mgnify:FL=1|tara:strand:+ start:2550 stop:2984 length:435 start_codon:yes stop_codon:yes gene_type:complete